MRPTVALMTLALGLPLLTGCGGSSEGDKDPDAQASKQLRSSGAPTFTCADKAKPAALPDAFPKDFPLPAGSVVIGSETRSGGRVIVYAVSPKDEKTTLTSMQAITKAGFTLTEGETEADDAESNWNGNGYVGRWAIRTIDGCEGQTSVTVLAAKQ